MIARVGLALCGLWFFGCADSSPRASTPGCIPEAPETFEVSGETGSPSRDSPCAFLADSLMGMASGWYTGTAGTVDERRARRTFEEADRTSHPVARMWIARALSRGRMDFPEDRDRARALAAEVLGEVREAAAAGWTEAVFLMGSVYDEGLGVPENPEEARRWFLQAAETGHVLAAHNLGNAFFSGRGGPQDDSAAVYWWTRAAEAGDAIPQLRLGEVYEAGRGVAPSVERARAWYENAARRGNAAAEEALRRLDGADSTAH